jgi:hypothetical protein
LEVKVDFGFEEELVERSLNQRRSVAVVARQAG